MAKKYVQVDFVANTDYKKAVSFWAPNEKAHADVAFESGVFEFDLAELKPGKYKLTIWKGKKTDNEKSPKGSITLTRIEEEEETSSSTSAGKEVDFTW